MDLLILDNLIFSVNAVVPVFLILILGYILKEKGITDQHTISRLNTLIFNVALPMLLFRDISGSNFRDFFDVKLLLTAIAITMLSFVLIWIAAELFIKDKGSIGAFVQGAFRSNYALVGLALVSNIAGKEAVTTGALITASVLPLYNVLSVIALTFRSEGDSIDGVKSVIINIVKNPLIIAIFIAMIFSIFNIKVPFVLEKSIEYMAGLATPLAMVTIGGTISLAQLKEKKIKLALIASVIKTAIIPIIFVPVVIFLGIRGNALLVLYIMCGAPAATSSYIMACKMNGDAELASEIFIITTLLSVFTFTIGIYLFKTFGLLA